MHHSLWGSVSESAELDGGGLGDLGSEGAGEVVVGGCCSGSRLDVVF